MNIKFYKPYITGKEIIYIKDLLKNNRDLSGDGIYTKKVQEFLQKRYRVPKVLLTTSGTSALEFAVRLLRLQEGDEIIAPSFTFSSTVNAALLLKGITVVFSEIDKDTMNIDPADIERKITKKTKALIVVHYAGIACDMDKIMRIAKKWNLFVIEDAAQGIEAKHKDKYLGTIGDLGCISFHDTKNITSGGEGGALFINRENKEMIERAEILREKGTNRSNFIRGLVDKYTWVDIGSSYLPSDMLAAFLLAQLEAIEEITQKRKTIYENYLKNFKRYEKEGLIKFPIVPLYAKHNAHIFYMLFTSHSDRNKVMDFVRSKGIGATFHYIPLHSAPQGKKLGNKTNDLPITEKLSNSLLRLPLYPHLKKSEQAYVIKIVSLALTKLKEGSL